jgi:CelD/BcsL family acetyltransferase involved in cellulose biosynthesis
VLTPDGRLGACGVDPLSDPRWAELVEWAPRASVFHHPLWLSLLSECYRYPIVAVCLQEPGGRLVAGLPIATVRSRLTGTRLVSVPFSDVCPPIVDSDAQERALLAAVDAERTRCALPLEVHAEVPSLPGGATSESFYRHLIPLEGGRDDVLRRVAQPKRRAASKADKLGVEVHRRTDEGALDSFFRLHVLTRHKHGLPTQPRSFFRGLTRLFDSDLGFVLLAEWEETPIGASVFLKHRETLTYKYGASDPKHLEKRPNDLLMLEALALGCEYGCTTLDLGRTEDYNDGLRRFKRQLGAEEQVLTYTAAPPREHADSVRSVSSLQQRVIRRLPPAFGRALGAAVYHHFG